VVAAAFILGAAVVTLLYSLADSRVQHE
jgi:hypothetical protein